MKHLKQILFTLSILLSITNLSFALDICPGETKTMLWSSSDSISCTPNVTGTLAGAAACNFNPIPNVGDSKTVTVPSGTGSGQFCQSTITCSGVAQSATSVDTLNVKTLGWCEKQNRGMCPAGQVPNTFVTGGLDAGNGCVTPTATVNSPTCQPRSPPASQAGVCA